MLNYMRTLHLNVQTLLTKNRAVTFTVTCSAKQDYHQNKVSP